MTDIHLDGERFIDGSMICQKKINRRREILNKTINPIILSPLRYTQRITLYDSDIKYLSLGEKTKNV